MIETRNIGKRYALGRDAFTQVLDGVSIKVGDGEFVAITGPSGAGKTTLLHILGMLDGDYSGQYWFDGEQVDGLSERRRKTLARDNLAMIFQDYRLIGDLTVAENVAVPLQYRKLPRDQIRQRVTHALERVALTDMASRYPHQLSGGLQQLAGIARAIANQPRLVLADEPTGNLHSSQGERIMRALSELHANGSTILLVTHNQENARYAEREIEMLDGKVVKPPDSQLEQVS